MLGCWMAAIASASVRKRILRVAESRSPERTVLRATTRPSRTCRALNTIPMPPRPSCSKSSYPGGASGARSAGGSSGSSACRSGLPRMPERSSSPPRGGASARGPEPAASRSESAVSRSSIFWQRSQSSTCRSMAVRSAESRVSSSSRPSTSGVGQVLTVSLPRRRMVPDRRAVVRCLGAWARLAAAHEFPDEFLHLALGGVDSGDRHPQLGGGLRP